MIKKNMKKCIISSILILLPILAGLIFWNRLPDSMTTHFGADGNPDGTMGKAVAVFVLPLILLAVWLRNSRGWGNWILWVGVVLGIICAVDGLRVSLKAMEKMSRHKEQQAPPVSFNDHD